MIRPRTLRTAALPLLAALALAAVQPAAAQLGVAGGLNFESFSDISVDSGESGVDGATGWHVGVFYDLAVGPIAIRPGLFYRQTGEFGVDSAVGSLTDFDLNLIEIPVDLRYRIGAPLVPIKPYFLAGPVFTLPSSSDDAYEDAVADFTLSGAVGAGVEVTLVGTGIKLFPEVRYQFGLGDYLDQTQIAGQTIAADENENLSSFMIRLGVAL
jgi:hypothetical protein